MFLFNGHFAVNDWTELDMRNLPVTLCSLSRLVIQNPNTAPFYPQATWRKAGTWTTPPCPPPWRTPPPPAPRPPTGSRRRPPKAGCSEGWSKYKMINVVHLPALSLSKKKLLPPPVMFILIATDYCTIREKRCYVRLMQKWDPLKNEDVIGINCR